MTVFVGGAYEDIPAGTWDWIRGSGEHMTGVTMAPEQARKSVELAIDELQREASEFLTNRGGAAPLGDLLHQLHRRGYSGELVSRSLAAMLSADRVRLTSDRRVVLA
jgi:hypothetical protein